MAVTRKHDKVKYKITRDFAAQCSLFTYNTLFIYLLTSLT